MSTSFGVRSGIIMHAPAVLVVPLILPLLATVLHAQPQPQPLDANCAPAACGSLTIKYPFWLRGRQPPYCGYPTFGVTCDDPTGATPPSLDDPYLRVLHIHYGNSSVVAFHANLVERTACLATRFNMSTSFALSLLAVSDANSELLFCANCSLPPPTGSLRMNCTGFGGGEWFLHLSQRYEPGGHARPEEPVGCQYSVVPVLPGSELRALSDYVGIVRRGFLLEWTVPGDCAACNASGGQCRYEANVKTFRCLCPDGRFQPATCGTERTGRRIILIVLTAAAASLLFPCIYVLIWHRKGQKLQHFLCTKTSSTSGRNIEALIVSYGSLAPTRYKYSEVTKITSFLNNKLGEGGYGVVFKGRLQDGRLVAVKFLHDSKGEGEEFVNEVMSIGRTSHVNIVSLFGFCLEGSKRALIYEYMPNGSLDNYIYSENPKEILGWDKLYGIAIGIARGLEYLHHSCNTRIVHFDIKPQNILLDQDFCPKIADFGLAKLCRTKESKLSMTGARGTIGFIAPEVLYRAFGVVSTKSDVYGYGMMLLEMVGGRKNVKSMVEKSSEKYFPDWIYDHFTQDDGLQACEVTNEVEQIAKKMTLIGLWCVQVLPMNRPTITQVLDMFERGLDELDMPPKQNFAELLEDPFHGSNAKGTSYTSTVKAQALSEVLRVEETSLVSSKILQRLPTL